MIFNITSISDFPLSFSYSNEDYVFSGDPYGDWTLKLCKTGILTIDLPFEEVDFFLIGGGRGGGGSGAPDYGVYGGPGGDGGKYLIKNGIFLDDGTYSVTIGAGGEGNYSNGGGNWGSTGFAGEPTIILNKKDSKILNLNSDNGSSSGSGGSRGYCMSNGNGATPGGNGGSGILGFDGLRYGGGGGGGAGMGYHPEKGWTARKGSGYGIDRGGNGGTYWGGDGENGALNSGSGGGGGGAGYDGTGDIGYAGNGGSGVIIIRNHRSKK